MWSGRFREPLDPVFETWQRSLGFDWRLLPYEVAASRAHARALEKLGVLTADEVRSIRAGLDQILAQFEADSSREIGRSNSGIGVLARRDPRIASRSTAEDIHHFVEMELKAAIGETALKLHTGRSRNEQIATDLRLYVREAAATLRQDLDAWKQAFLTQARAASENVMPAYTHLQRAEPVLVAQWMMAYVAMIERDQSRLKDCARRANFCPLGSGAVAGATLKLDRAMMAEELGFEAPTGNSMDAVSDRDFVLEFLQSLAQTALHISRFAEEITLYATAEFGFVELPEAFSTGSSAMPQKKNPDLTELARAKAGHIVAASHTVELQLKALPLTYNKDLQELGPALFQAAEESHALLGLLARFTAALEFRVGRMRNASVTGFLNAMAAATYLVHKGIPFRTAHEIIGRAVRQCLERGCELDGLTLEELRRFSPAFEPDFFAAITLDATLDCHDVSGGTARQRVREALQPKERDVGDASGDAGETAKGGGLGHAGA